MPDTLATIRQRVEDWLSSSGNDEIYATERVNRAINASNLRLGREHDWPWLLSIGTLSWTGGSSTFDLTTLSNFRHIKRLSYENGRVYPVSPSEFVHYSTETGDVPRFYTIIGNTLYVSPIPGTTTSLDIVYVLDENQLLNDNDQPLLPSAYTELLALKAATMLAVGGNNAERLSMLRSEYASAIIEARDEVRRTRELSSIQYDDSLWRMI